MLVLSLLIINYITCHYLNNELFTGFSVTDIKAVIILSMLPHVMTSNQKKSPVDKNDKQNLWCPNAEEAFRGIVVVCQVSDN